MIPDYLKRLKEIIKGNADARIMVTVALVIAIIYAAGKIVSVYFGHH